MARTRGRFSYHSTRTLPKPLTARLPSKWASSAKDYPGLGLPLRDYPQRHGHFYPMGAHGNCHGSDSELLPVREVAMMNIMDRLTDKDNWHLKVFDPEIVEKWRKEASEIPDDELWRQAAGHNATDLMPLTEIMTSDTFDYVRPECACVPERALLTRAVHKRASR